MIRANANKKQEKIIDEQVLCSFLGVMKKYYLTPLRIIHMIESTLNVKVMY